MKILNNLAFKAAQQDNSGNSQPVQPQPYAPPANDAGVTVPQKILQAMMQPSSEAAQQYNNIAGGQAYSSIPKQEIPDAAESPNNFANKLFPGLNLSADFFHKFMKDALAKIGLRVDLPLNNSQPVSEVKAVSKTPKTDEIQWKNDLKTVFQNNKAVIYALAIRSFNAKDPDKSGLIEPDNGEESGNFMNAIDRLDELKSLGVNALHLLPIHPPGKKGALGTAGSLYAPADFLTIDPKLADPKSSLSVEEQAKKFVQECHKRGIRVMLDLPSCASVDLYEKRPELMAVDLSGNPKVPQGWMDIRMFNPWKDEKNKVLNEDLYKMHEQFVDMCVSLGADGIRADVARAKPVEFWDRLIKYSRSKDPDFAWLAESYTYEDASPMANMPKDRPEDLLRTGFDSYYGQYHIFHEWKTAKDLQDYVISNLEMSQRLGPNKSMLGSFATHDDRSPMAHGGVPYCNLTTGLQATLPMTNPYFLAGFESGDKYIYPYKDKISAYSITDNNVADVHTEMMDIFNFSRKPGGNNPEVGKYIAEMMKVRKQYEDVITRGSYIPLKVEGNTEDDIIAYARHFNGKTLVVIANKDVNAVEKGRIIIPTLKVNQELKDFAPESGLPSQFNGQNNSIEVALAPAGFHMFEVDTPQIEQNSPKVYRQNLVLEPLQTF